MLRDLIIKNRSYRRFYQSERIEKETLIELVDLVRLSASARNAQPIQYFLSCDEETNNKIFPHLGWAGYLTDWDGPQEGEKPSAYIVLLLNTNITTFHHCDDGIASQSILLGAVEKGLGGCIIASVVKPKLVEALQLPAHLSVIHVIALGKPKETVVIEEMKENNFKYWRSEDEVHHVPKRKLNDLIIEL